MTTTTKTNSGTAPIMGISAAATTPNSPSDTPATPNTRTVTTGNTPHTEPSDPSQAFAARIFSETNSSDNEEAIYSSFFTRIEDLQGLLGARITNNLLNAGVEYFYELLLGTEADLLKLTRFGRGNLNKLNEILSERNLSIGILRGSRFAQNLPDTYRHSPLYNDQREANPSFDVKAVAAGMKRIAEEATAHVPKKTVLSEDTADARWTAALPHLWKRVQDLGLTNANQAALQRSGFDFIYQLLITPPEKLQILKLDYRTAQQADDRLKQIIENALNTLGLSMGMLTDNISKWKLLKSLLQREIDQIFDPLKHNIDAMIIANQARMEKFKAGTNATTAKLIRKWTDDIVRNFGYLKPLRAIQDATTSFGHPSPLQHHQRQIIQAGTLNEQVDLLAELERIQKELPPLRAQVAAHHRASIQSIDNFVLAEYEWQESKVNHHLSTLGREGLIDTRNSIIALPISSSTARPRPRQAHMRQYTHFNIRKGIGRHAITAAGRIARASI